MRRERGWGGVKNVKMERGSRGIERRHEIEIKPVKLSLSYRNSGYDCRIFATWFSHKAVHLPQSSLFINLEHFWNAKNSNFVCQFHLIESQTFWGSSIFRGRSERGGVEKES